MEKPDSNMGCFILVTSLQVVLKIYVSRNLFIFVGLNDLIYIKGVYISNFY